MSATWRIIEGDCRDTLAALSEASVQTCVTSPPYFGLRDYGHDDQIGAEPTPDTFVHSLVEVFRAVRRVLRDDGTVWLNLGDSFWTAKGTPGGSRAQHVDPKNSARRFGCRTTDGPPPAGLKRKDLIGIPWRVALALQADGWLLRCDIIWEKPNFTPEGSAHDRPMRSHEYIFLLSKKPRYVCDMAAISEQAEHNQRYARVSDAHTERVEAGRAVPGNQNNIGIHSRPGGDRRHKRSVWKVSTVPFAGAHFAAFPPKLIEPCILAGCPEGGTVLDPFAGSGTTGMVALRHGRSFIGCELNPAYAALARERIIGDSPLLNTHAQEMAA